MIENQREIFTVIEDNIRKISYKKGKSLASLIAEIDMTEGGFYKMLKAESLKVKVLKKIADYLETPIQCFFESDVNFQTIKGDHNVQTNKSQIVGEQVVEYNKVEDGLKKQVEILERQILDKDEIIKLLKQQTL